MVGMNINEGETMVEHGQKDNWMVELSRRLVEHSKKNNTICYLCLILDHNQLHCTYKDVVATLAHYVLFLILLIKFSKVYEP